MTLDRKRYLELIEARINNPASLQKALKKRALDPHRHILARLVENHGWERVKGFAEQSESELAPSNQDRELQYEYLSSFFNLF